MNPNAQQPPRPLDALRQTLEQAEELINEGYTSHAALRLAQLGSEVADKASELAARALNSLNQPPVGFHEAIRLVVPQHEPIGTAAPLPNLGNVISHETAPVGAQEAR